MSHVVKVKALKITDPGAIGSAVDRLPDVHLIAPGGQRVGTVDEATGAHNLYGEKTNAGVGVQLPGWHYPVIINTETGEVAFDNYSGHWGKEIELDRFVQAYAVERTKMEAMAQNFAMAQEEELPDGSIKLSYQLY